MAGWLLFAVVVGLLRWAWSGDGAGALGDPAHIRANLRLDWAILVSLTLWLAYPVG